MCGLAGIFAPGDRPAEGQVRRALQALAHRGPDARAVSSLRGCTFGYTRLAIRHGDDSDARFNHQPFVHARGATMFAVGEVYAEAASLEDAVAPNGDLAALLAVHETHGPAALAAVDAEFAAAIWDEAAQVGVLARDLMGVKPLFYAHDGERTLFASEVKALEAMGVALESCPIGVTEYLRFGYVMAPRTLYQGIRSVPAGGNVRCWDGGLSEHPRSTGTADGPAFGDAAELIACSSRRRTVADVPVGFHLSGGLDSSTICSSAASRGSRAYTLVYRSASTDGAGDAFWASEVARDLGLRHRVVTVEPDEALRGVDSCIDVLDAPLMSPGALTPCLLARAAKDDVKVMVTGQGADELFLGYERFKVATATPVANLASVAANVVATDLDDVMLSRGASRVGDCAFSDLVAAIDGTSLQAFQVAYAATFLQELLRIEDHAHMAVAVENRVPFLAPPVATLLLGTARDDEPATPKRALREYLASVGSPAARRTRKQQMRLPAQAIRPWAVRVLEAPGALDRLPLFSRHGVADLLRRPVWTKSQDNLAWALANVCRWAARKDLVVEGVA